MASILATGPPEAPSIAAMQFLGLTQGLDETSRSAMPGTQWTKNDVAFLHDEREDVVLQRKWTLLKVYKAISDQVDAGIAAQGTAYTPEQVKAYKDALFQQA